MEAETNIFSLPMGSLYEKLVGETSSRLAATALSKLPPSTFEPTSHILDSACGPGVVSKLLLSPPPDYLSVPGLPVKPPPQVTGIDISESMIEQYRTNKSALGWETADYYTQDSQDLSRFPDGVFDAIVMNLGIFALPDAHAGAREMHRVLKPGGHAVVTTWKTRRPQEMMNLAADSIHPEGSGRRVMDIDSQWLTGGHLVDVMTGGGFKRGDVKLTETAPNWTFSSLDALLDALSSPMWTAQFCRGWSDEELGRWADEVAKQLTQQEKATYSLEMVAHVCISQK
ncbi:S-adenosyl-L-methionine-dependent methyltransferase [Poronia punctata]|nr:S-adenosyl-L-methionine-dependent methyltransferase [Poronia punctata]